jgi:hypothetical protein
MGSVGVGVMTGGLVGEFEHAVLPVVKPLHTFVLTLAASTVRTTRHSRQTRHDTHDTHRTPRVS